VLTQTEGAPAGTRSPDMREAGVALRSDTRTIGRSENGASGFPESELDALRRARTSNPSAPWWLKASPEQLAGLVAVAVRIGVELPAAVAAHCRGLGLALPAGVRSFPVLGSEGRRLSRSRPPTTPRTGKERSFPRCVYPQHILAAEKGGTALAPLELRCRRWTCPGCRVLLAAEHGGRVLEAFAAQSMYLETVRTGEWEAWRKRAKAAGVEWARTPSGPFTFAVLSTDALGPNAEEVAPARRAEVVAEVLSSRPHYGNRDKSPGNLSSSRGFLPPAQPAAKPEAELEKAWHRVGSWSPDPAEETAAQVFRKAAEQGLPAELLEPTAALQAGVRVEIDWANSEQVAAAARFLRSLAFVAFKGADSPPLCDAWQDDGRIGYDTGREPEQARLAVVA
jgi:hypothetical protein